MTNLCMQTVHSQYDAADLDVIDPRLVLAHLAVADSVETTAQQVRRQAVRDAHTAGAPITEIAATLGIRNRVGLYQMIDEQPGPAEAPALTPAVFVRGPGVDSATWAALTAALHGRGWMVVRDRTQAWHLARGRVPVVLVDISQDQPVVGRVRARYNDAQEPELPLAGGRTVLESADLDQVALAVIEHLQDPRNLPVSPPRQPPAPRPSADLKAEDETKRSIFVSDQLWSRAKAAVTAGHAPTLHTLVTSALARTLTGLEDEHHSGRVFPSVNRLPTGPKTFHTKSAPGKARQISLPESIWDRARAVVAAGHAASLPALLTHALQQHLAEAVAGADQ